MLLHIQAFSQLTNQSAILCLFVFFGLISAMPVHSTSFPPNLFQSEDLPCRDAEMLSHLLRCRRCSISLLKSGMDQSVAFCASPAAGSSAFPVSAACGHFPNPLQWIRSFTFLDCGCCRLSTFTFTYPLTARVIWASQLTSQPVFSSFLCSPLPSGTWRTPGLSIPWCCLPTSSSVCLVVVSPQSPFHCALQDGFSQTWSTGDMSIPLQFTSHLR